MTRCLISAGEPSGDLHAAALLRALARLAPEWRMDAVGGRHLRAAGANVLWDLARLSATGLVESARTLPAHVRLLWTLDRRLAAGRYNLVILVDYPGLNLRLARRAARYGIPVLYYIAPQVWAWAPWRLAALRRDVRRLAVILPFEQPFFRRHGVAARFVGHPLLDLPERPSRAEARSTLGIAPGVPVLGLFPGSRAGDVVWHAPVFAAAAHHVRCAVPDLEVWGAGSTGARAIAPHLQWHDDPALVRAAADLALVKSGTATLEAALDGLPMVIAYRMHPFTFQVARRLVRVPHVGLVNLVAGERVVPELVQPEATPRRLAEAALPLLDASGPGAARQRAAFHRVRERLGAPGAAGRVAVLARELAA